MDVKMTVFRFFAIASVMVTVYTTVLYDILNKNFLRESQEKGLKVIKEETVLSVITGEDSASYMNDYNYEDSWAINRESSYNDPLHEKPKRQFPKCIIVGVSKCGTRALLEFLSLNPHIVTAKYEMNFFNNDTLYERGIEWYREKMPLSFSDQITVEKSPDYFECSKCPFRIYAMNRTIRLLVLLRDPVERLISQYMQLVDKTKKIGLKLPPFKQWVRDPSNGKVNTKIPSVRVGVYVDYIKKWLAIFPRNQFLFIDSGRFTNSPATELTKVESFLGLEPYLSEADIHFNQSKRFYCMRNRFTMKTRCLGPGKGRAHIQVDKETMQMLRDFYRPHNQRLKNLLGIWMSWF